MSIIGTPKIYRRPKMSNSQKIISLERNYNIIIVTALIVLGILAGSIIVGSSEMLNSFASSIYENVIISIKDQSFSSIFLSDIFSSAVYIFLFFIMGLNAIGVPFVYLLSCVKGMSSGIISGYLYMNFGFKGMEISLALLFPYALISSVLTILIGNISLKMSHMLFSDLSGKFIINDNNITLKKYCVHFSIYTVLFIIASLIDALFKFNFSDIVLN